MRRARGWLVWIIAAIGIGAFFLPWVEVRSKLPDGTDVREQLATLEQSIGRVEITIRKDGKVISGELPPIASLPARLSGWNIPIVANRRDLSAAVSLLSTMEIAPEGAGWKSCIVYVIPFLLILSAGILAAFRRSQRVAAAVGFVCLGVPFGTIAKIMQAGGFKPDSPVTVGFGLWLSLAAPAALALVSFFAAASCGRAKLMPSVSSPTGDRNDRTVARG